MSSLSCRSLTKFFADPPVEVLRSVSFDIDKGEFLAITGRSGSGKSTLLYALSGLDRPSSGSVMFDGRSLYEMPESELDDFRNTRMGFVFQFHYLLPELNSLENVLMPARKLKLEKQKRERAREMLMLFNLEHCVAKYPGQMSGGEQQRVAVARALIMEPDFLFADEPTGNLDSVTSEDILRMFQELNRDDGLTIILVTHDEHVAAHASRVIHISDGLIVEGAYKTPPPPTLLGGGQ
jgi:ABC-type lipoprotein export system ATPase subunit